MLQTIEVRRMSSQSPTRPSKTATETVAAHAVGVADAELLAHITRGDRIAFATLLETHLTSIVRIANTVLRDAAEAEDVAQEICLKIWSAPEKVHAGPSGIMTWVYRATINQAIDRQRQRRRTDVTDTPPDRPVSARQQTGLEEQELGSRVDRALAQLPERQQLALRLFHYEGLSQQEVADALTCSADAVESLLSRARRALRTDLEDEWRQLLPEYDTANTSPHVTTPTGTTP